MVSAGGHDESPDNSNMAGSDDNFVEYGPFVSHAPYDDRWSAALEGWRGKCATLDCFGSTGERLSVVQHANDAVRLVNGSRHVTLWQTAKWPYFDTLTVAGLIAWMISTSKESLNQEEESWVSLCGHIVLPRNSTFAGRYDDLAEYGPAVSHTKAASEGAVGFGYC
jgi:hypothetical protein